MEKTPDYWKFIEDCDDAIDNLLVLQEEKGIDVSEKISLIADFKFEAKEKGLSKGLYYYLADIEYYIEDMKAEGSAHGC